jgi:hypothetical protein
MSRRHHGRSRHARGRDDVARLPGIAQPEARASGAATNERAPEPVTPPERQDLAERLEIRHAAPVPAPSDQDRGAYQNGAPSNGARYQNGAPTGNGAPPSNGASHATGQPSNGFGQPNSGVHHNGGPAGAGHGPSGLNGAPGTNGAHDQRDQNALRSGCTAPQLRRFIKSRPYVPMHELRRRFGIFGAEDDVSPLAVDDGRVYVGLPERECRLLSELVRGGEVGYELSLDPRTPIVVGVYPMRPVPRA